MKDDIKVFAQATRSKVTGRTAGSMGFGGKFRHSILNVFKYEMHIIHPRRDIMYSYEYTVLDFMGKVQARDRGSI